MRQYRHFAHHNEKELSVTSQRANAENFHKIMRAKGIWKEHDGFRHFADGTDRPVPVSFFDTPEERAKTQKQVFQSYHYLNADLLRHVKELDESIKKFHPVRTAYVPKEWMTRGTKKAPQLLDLEQSYRNPNRKYTGMYLDHRASFENVKQMLDAYGFDPEKPMSDLLALHPNAYRLLTPATLGMDKFHMSPEFGGAAHGGTQHTVHNKFGSVAFFPNKKQIWSAKEAFPHFPRTERGYNDLSDPELQVLRTHMLQTKQKFFRPYLPWVVSKNTVEPRHLFNTKHPFYAYEKKSFGRRTHASYRIREKRTGKVNKLFTGPVTWDWLSKNMPAADVDLSTALGDGSKSWTSFPLHQYADGFQATLMGKVHTPYQDLMRYSGSNRWKLEGAVETRKLIEVDFKTSKQRSGLRWLLKNVPQGTDLSEKAKEPRFKEDLKTAMEKAFPEGLPMSADYTDAMSTWSAQHKSTWSDLLKLIPPILKERVYTLKASDGTPMTWRIFDSVRRAQGQERPPKTRQSQASALQHAKEVAPKEVTPPPPVMPGLEAVPPSVRAPDQPHAPLEALEEKAFEAPEPQTQAGPEVDLSPFDHVAVASLPPVPQGSQMPADAKLPATGYAPRPAATPAPDHAAYEMFDVPKGGGADSPHHIVGLVRAHYSSKTDNPSKFPEWLEKRRAKFETRIRKGVPASFSTSENTVRRYLELDAQSILDHHRGTGHAQTIGDAHTHSDVRRHVTAWRKRAQIGPEEARDGLYMHLADYQLTAGSSPEKETHAWNDARALYGQLKAQFKAIGGDFGKQGIKRLRNTLDYQGSKASIWKYVTQMFGRHKGAGDPQAYKNDVMGAILKVRGLSRASQALAATAATRQVANQKKRLEYIQKKVADAIDLRASAVGTAQAENAKEFLQTAIALSRKATTVVKSGRDVPAEFKTMLGSNKSSDLEKLKRLVQVAVNRAKRAQQQVPVAPAQAPVAPAQAPDVPEAAALPESDEEDDWPDFGDLGEMGYREASPSVHSSDMSTVISDIRDDARYPDYAGSAAPDLQVRALGRRLGLIDMFQRRTHVHAKPVSRGELGYRLQHPHLQRHGTVHLVHMGHGARDDPDHFMQDIEGDANMGRIALQGKRRGPFKRERGSSRVMSRSAHVTIRKRRLQLEISVHADVQSHELDVLFGKLRAHSVSVAGTIVYLVHRGSRKKLGTLDMIDLEKLKQELHRLLATTKQVGILLVDKFNGGMHHHAMHTARYARSYRRQKRNYSY